MAGHAARRVFRRRVEEFDARLGESTVRRIVAELLRELRDGVSLVAVPQTHPPAEEAVVDSAGSNSLG